MPRTRNALLGLAATLFAGAATAEPLDTASHYSGRWLEVARTPDKLTDGCVAGSTTYLPIDSRRFRIVDDCRKGGPGGKRQSIAGRGVITDPGTDHVLKVNYAPFVTWRFQVFDHDPAGHWFISGDPELKRMFVYAREKPSPALLANLVARVRATGYAGELETPEQQ